MSREIEGRRRRTSLRLISRKPIEQPKQKEPITIPTPFPTEQKQKPIEEDNDIIIEQNPEPKTMIEKHKQEKEKTKEIKRKWALEHRDIITKNVRISKLRTWLLKHKKASDYNQATEKAKDFISKGIDTIEKLNNYYIDLAKEEAKEEQKEQKNEAVK
jgi:hypothetical protein